MGCQCSSRASRTDDTVWHRTTSYASSLWPNSRSARTCAAHAAWPAVHTPARLCHSDTQRRHAHPLACSNQGRMHPCVPDALTAAVVARASPAARPQRCRSARRSCSTPSATTARPRLKTRCRASAAASHTPSRTTPRAPRASCATTRARPSSPQASAPSSAASAGAPTRRRRTAAAPCTPRPAARARSPPPPTPVATPPPRSSASRSPSATSSSSAWCTT